MTPASIKVLDLYLDIDNPRHGQDDPENQESIIKRLVEKEQIKPLARDIVQNGLSPIDLIAVIKDSQNHYVAIEGNRRLCALILLNDPDKYPPEREYFKKLAQEANSVPTTVSCMLFDSREDVDIWIERKHEGEQGGVGTRNWTPEGKLRHNQRKERKDQNALASSLIEYSINHGFIERENGSRILTTATRYLGNPFFRSTLGIATSRSDGDVKINTTHEDFNRTLKIFIHDLLENKSVNSRTKKRDWEEYAKSLIADSLAPSITDTEVLLNDFKGKASDTKPGSATLPNKPTTNNSARNNAAPVSKASNQLDKGSQERNNPHPDTRRYIVPYDFRIPINDKALRRFFEELRTLVAGDAPLAVSLVCRVFLERLYRIYFKSVNGCDAREGGDKVHILIGHVIKIIEADNSLSVEEKNALGGLKRVQSNQNNVLSPKTLGSFAHGGIYPNATELKREWDNISEILKYMLRRI